MCGPGGEVDEQHQRHLTVGEVGLARAHIVDQRVHPAAEGLIGHGFAPSRLEIDVSEVKPVSGRFVSLLSQKETVRSAAIAGAEHFPGGAQAERVAALGPAGLGRGPPGEGVEMRPGGVLRARISAGTRRRSPRRRAAPRPYCRYRRRRRRASPHNVSRAASARAGRTPPRRRRASPAASASSLANKAGRSGPSATRAAPVRVAKSRISSGFSSAARVSASAEDQPPFRVGIADLDGEALAALQDVAGAEGVAGHRILDRRDDEVQADRQAGPS